MMEADDSLDGIRNILTWPVCCFDQLRLGQHFPQFVVAERDDGAEAIGARRHKSGAFRGPRQVSQSVNNTGIEIHEGSRSETSNSPQFKNKYILLNIQCMCISI